VSNKILPKKNPWQSLGHNCFKKKDYISFDLYQKDQLKLNGFFFSGNHPC
jgi:uncharacterized protein YutD